MWLQANCEAKLAPNFEDPTRVCRAPDGQDGAVEAYPLAATGTKCTPAVLSFNAAHSEMSVRSYMHELMDAVAANLGGYPEGKGLLGILPAEQNAEACAEIRQVLKDLKRGKLPGCDVLAPKAPATV